MALSSSPGIAQQYVAGAAGRGAPWAQRLARQNVPQQGIAGTYVQNHANSGAPWAQRLAGSPWGGHGQNTQAGWQQAGYGQPQSSTPGPSTSTPGPAPPPTPPALDSTYYANVNAHNVGVGNQINALAKQSGYNTTDYNDQLGNLAYQQPRDELQTEEAAGHRGGVYSTVLDQQLGDLTHRYQTKGADLQKAYTRNQTAIASQGNALWAGIPLYASQQAADATVRAANANAKNPALGESTKPLTPAQQSSVHTLATALATAHRTGRTQRTLTQGRTVISRPNGTQQATHTAGGMFGGTVTRTPAQIAALRALLGGK